MDVIEFFTSPQNARQKQYEALRRVFSLGDFSSDSSYRFYIGHCIATLDKPCTAGHKLWMDSIRRKCLKVSSPVSALASGWQDQPEIAALLKDRAENDINADVHYEVVSALAGGWQDQPEIAVWLKDQAENDANESVHYEVVSALASGWQDQPEIAVWLKDQAENDANESVRSAAMSALRDWATQQMKWLAARSQTASVQPIQH